MNSTDNRMQIVFRTSRLSIKENMSLLEDNLLMQRLTTTDHSHEEDEEHHKDDMSSILIAKGITMIILCTVSTCMGILPMQLAKYFKWNTSDVGNPRYRHN